MDNKQIKHMVDRFLGWRLPDTFNPDGGISAVRPNYAPNVSWEPTGTNLLTATQADEMVQYMLEGLPSSMDERISAWANSPEGKQQLEGTAQKAKEAVKMANDVIVR